MRGDHRVGDRDESLRQPAREKLKKKTAWSVSVIGSRWLSLLGCC